MSHTLNELVAVGDLEGALDSLKSEARSRPTCPTVRANLCALFFLAGDERRAIQQYELSVKLGGAFYGPHFLLGLGAGQQRLDAYAGKVPAYTPGVPTDWMEKHQKALADLDKGDVGPLDQFNETFDEEIVGTLNVSRARGSEKTSGKGFFNLDWRLHPYIEGVFDGRYTWLRVDEIQQMSLPNEVGPLSNLVMLPVKVSLKSGWMEDGYLFTTYPGSHFSESSEVRMGMATSWGEGSEDAPIGRGHQLFRVGDEDLPIGHLGYCIFGSAGSAS